MAMSAGTMIACSCKEIWMGKQSSLGPVDPQFNGVPAHGVVEEFKRAYADITRDPKTIPIWQPIIAKYPPAFIGECEKAVEWSTNLVEEWLKRNMFSKDDDADNKIEAIIKELVDHSVSLAHNRHLSSSKCHEIGLNIKKLEDDQELQDKVLSVHHIYYHTLGSSTAFKIIENSNGMAFILQSPNMPLQQNSGLKQNLEQMQETPVNDVENENSKDA